MTNRMNYLFNAKLVYIHSDTPQYVRASKCIPVFAKLFREVHFIGCSRGNRWNPNEGLPCVHYHLNDRTLAHGARSFFSAIGFLGYIRDKLKEIQPDLVVATNEEYILPFALGYFPQQNNLICDLIDSLAIRMTGPLRHLWPLWSLLSVLAKKKMDGMIEVTEERLARHSFKPKHCTVIYNSPKWSNVEPMPNLPSPAIYVCGSTLDGHSGVDTLLAAVEQVPEISIVFAGRLVGSWLNSYFIKHPKVLNLGEVTPAESLRIAKSCKAIFAHYKPFIPNYIYAAPNKLFDAMMLGVPLLINSECKASVMAERFGFGVLTPFGDVEAMVKALERLVKIDSTLQENCKHAQEVFRKEYAWDHMEQRLIHFFHDIGIST